MPIFTLPNAQRRKVSKSADNGSQIIIIWLCLCVRVSAGGQKECKLWWGFNYECVTVEQAYSVNTTILKWLHVGPVLKRCCDEKFKG